MPELYQVMSPPSRYHYSVEAAGVPTELHPWLVVPRHGPQRVRPPQTKSVHCTRQFRPSPEVHSVCTSSNNQNDWRHIHMRQELFLVLQEHQLSILPDAQQYGYYPIQGVKHSNANWVVCHNVDTSYPHPDGGFVWETIGQHSLQMIHSSRASSTRQRPPNSCSTALSSVRRSWPWASCPPQWSKSSQTCFVCSWNCKSFPWGIGHVGKKQQSKCIPPSRPSFTRHILTTTIWWSCTTHNQVWDILHQPTTCTTCWTWARMTRMISQGQLSQRRQRQWLQALWGMARLLAVCTLDLSPISTKALPQHSTKLCRTKWLCKTKFLQCPWPSHPRLKQRPTSTFYPPSPYCFPNATAGPSAYAAAALSPDQWIWTWTARPDPRRT